jgi:PAS domain S-box-containing protein
MDESLYRLIVEQTSDYAVFALDPAGHILSWNLGAQRIKGYAPEDIIGRHFSVFYMPESVERGWPDHELSVAAKEGRFEDEGWRVRKDGGRFWASVTITALRDPQGGLIGFSKITRDLTERKRNEEALRLSEERFRLLVEGVVDYAIYMLDPDGVISSWNAGAQRIKGYAREEILGRHVSLFYTDDDKRAGRPAEELAAARRDGRAEDEGWRMRKDGERFWARVIVTALYDGDGRLHGFAKVTQDLTQRRHIQDLEKAARNVNEFVGMLAHELRNPLAPIRTAVQVMAQLPPGDPGHEAMRRTIDRQGAQLARIVDDMLDITRLTRGAFTLERAPLDIAEAVGRAAETALPQIEGRRHQLELDVPEGLCVEGDLHRLTQLLTNLLNNSARYTPAGGRIFVSARAEEGSVVVRVRDTGRGIAPGLIGRIFDMFVQGRAPLERVDGGLGVGLALARRIAELHHGTLEARSAGEGQGAELTLRLPALKGAVPVAEASPAAASPPLAPRRVLVVDDNEDAAASLALLLHSLGHETAVAKDGSEALRLAQEFRPDIVLLDIGMPGMDGYEVVRRLRELRRGRPVRVVAITGWGQEADRERSREAGFDLHLVKPLDPQDLAHALDDKAGAPRGGRTLH